MTATVIDLGDVSDPSGATPDGGDSRGREFRHGTVRRLVVAAMAFLCAVGLGASARPAPPLVRELWAVPFTDNDMMTLHGGQAFVHRFSDGRAEMTAYDVRTGAIQWVRQLGDRVGWIEAAAESGMLLFSSDEQTTEIEFPDGSRGVLLHGGTVTAVDPATGEVRWRQPGGYEINVSGDEVLLAERGPDGTVTAFRLVRIREGTVVWERRVAGAQQFAVEVEGPEPARLITASRAGEITVLGYADGVPRLSRILPWTEPAPGTGEGSSISAAPGLVLVTRSITPGEGSVTAYRADTLAKLWQRESNSHPWTHDCGPVLCLNNESTFEALDPRTGETRWSHAGSPSVGYFPGEEYLLASTPGDRPRQVLVESATGREKGSGARGWVAYRDTGAGTLLLVDGPTRDLTSSVISRLDLSTGRGWVLGSVPLSGTGRCSGTGPYLGCQRAGELVITAVG